MAAVVSWWTPAKCNAGARKKKLFEAPPLWDRLEI